jgi:hypothetical protein
MLLDDLVAERRRAARCYRTTPKPMKRSSPSLMAAMVVGVTPGLYLGFASDTLLSARAAPVTVSERYANATFAFAGYRALS